MSENQTAARHVYRAIDLSPRFPVPLRFERCDRNPAGGPCPGCGLDLGLVDCEAYYSVEVESNAAA